MHNRSAYHTAIDHTTVSGTAVHRQQTQQTQVGAVMYYADARVSQ